MILGANLGFVNWKNVPTLPLFFSVMFIRGKSQLGQLGKPKTAISVALKAWIL